MIMVSDLYATSLPHDFLDVLPHECDSCGSPTEITESLSMLRCSNPSCIEKSVQRLVSLLKDLGVKNMGESHCRKFLDHFGTSNPYAIFVYEPDEDGTLHGGCSEDFSYKFYNSLNEKRTMLLWEYVRVGNLPGIKDSARHLFANYDSLDEFYDDLDEGGVPFVQGLLSIKGKGVVDTDSFFEDEETGGGVSVRAIAVTDTLQFFRNDLYMALDYVNIKSLETEIVNICISTAVGRPFTSKSDFVSRMNALFGDKVHLNFLGSVSKDCQFLIWSKEGAKTTKVRKAESINAKREEKNEEDMFGEEKELIQIMTGLEFQDYLTNL